MKIKPLIIIWIKFEVRAERFGQEHFNNQKN